jgi:RNA polymerase sigma factor (sigma-70 family)
MSRRDAAFPGRIVTLLVAMTTSLRINADGAFRVGEALTREFRWQGLDTSLLPPAAFVDVESANPTLKSLVLARHAIDAVVDEAGSLAEDEAIPGWRVIRSPTDRRRAGGGNGNHWPDPCIGVCCRPVSDASVRFSLPEPASMEPNDESYAGQNDPDFLVAIRRGSRAFEELANWWRPRLTRRIQGYQIQQLDAEGIANQALVNFYRALTDGSFDPTRPVDRYLTQIASNLALTFLRQQRKQPGGWVEVDLPDPAQSDPRSGLVSQEDREKLLVCLLQLGMEERLVFLLSKTHGLGDWTLMEVQAILQLPNVSAVDRLKRCALDKLRACLSPHEGQARSPS